MAVHWIDVTTLSFNVLLLLERVQISWFPGWLPEQDLAIALVAMIVATVFAYLETSDYKDEKGYHKYQGAPNVRTIAYVDPGGAAWRVPRDALALAGGSTRPTHPW